MGGFPLYLACAFGHEDIVDVLLESGVNVNQALSSDGSTGLLIAIEEGYFSIVKKLINASADMHQASSFSFPLYMACNENHEDIVDYLLEKQVNVNQATEVNGRTSLMLSCIEGRSTIVKKLLAASANVKQRKKGGITALYIACQFNHLEIVQLLIDARCDLDIGHAYGSTPFYLACVKGFTEIAALLINSGCDIEKAATLDDEQWTALQAANNFKQTDIVDLINASIKKRKKKA